MERRPASCYVVPRDGPGSERAPTRCSPTQATVNWWTETVRGYVSAAVEGGLGRRGEDELTDEVVAGAAFSFPRRGRGDGARPRPNAPPPPPGPAAPGGGHHGAGRRPGRPPRP